MMRLVAPLLLFAWLAACGGVEPFYYKADEFNRASPTFVKEPSDIKAVGICYAKSSTTAEMVRDMAVARCAAYGKQAEFRGQDMLNCPILAPMRAIYACVAP